MHVLAFVSTHTYSSTQFATFQPSPWLLPGRYLTIMTMSCRYYSAYWQPMESVFWKPKSSLALNQHTHTQADHRVQFILHIHTHQQSPSNTPALHIPSALSGVSGVHVYVCVWCQAHIRGVFIMILETTAEGLLRSKGSPDSILGEGLWQKCP